MIRESGYYRVRRANDWEVGYYDSRKKTWSLIDYIRCFTDSEFVEIDEEKINFKK